MNQTDLRSGQEGLNRHLANVHNKQQRRKLEREEQHLEKCKQQIANSISRDQYILKHELHRLEGQKQEAARRQSVLQEVYKERLAEVFPEAASAPDKKSGVKWQEPNQNKGKKNKTRAGAKPSDKQAKQDNAKDTEKVAAPRSFHVASTSKRHQEQARRHSIHATAAETDKKSEKSGAKKTERKSRKAKVPEKTKAESTEGCAVAVTVTDLDEHSLEKVRESNTPVLEEDTSSDSIADREGTANTHPHTSTQSPFQHRNKMLDDDALERYYDLLAESEAKIREQDSSFMASDSGTHCPLGTMRRSQRWKVNSLRSVLKQLPSYKHKHQDIDPLEILNCSYLRLTDDNIKDLEELCQQQGKDGTIHRHLTCEEVAAAVDQKYEQQQRQKEAEAEEQLTHLWTRRSSMKGMHMANPSMSRFHGQPSAHGIFGNHGFVPSNSRMHIGLGHGHSNRHDNQQIHPGSKSFHGNTRRASLF